MIIAYSLDANNELQKQEMLASSKLPERTFWIDLLDPTLEEKRCIEKGLDIEIPTREEVEKLEVISPFYKEDDVYYMAVTAVNKTDSSYPESSTLSFIMQKNCLVSLRYSRLKAFQYFSSRFMRLRNYERSAEAILEGLVEALVHSLADALEKSGNEIDQLLIDVFEKPSQENKAKKSKKNNAAENSHSNYYSDLITKVGRTGNLISKIRESLVTFSRMLIFFNQLENSLNMQKKEQKARFRNLTREVHSLTEYSNFLSQRNAFLLDATLGMLNVEQNKIIKVFTVAAVLFMPPTLIASVYGMNFHSMPELALPFGYPMAILMMIISGFIPYQLFKRKGWF